MDSPGWNNTNKASFTTKNNACPADTPLMSLREQINLVSDSPDWLFLFFFFML